MHVTDELFPFAKPEQIIFETRSPPDEELEQSNPTKLHAICKQTKIGTICSFHSSKRSADNRLDKKEFINALRRAILSNDMSNNNLLEWYNQCVKYKLLRPLGKDEIKKSAPIIDVLFLRKYTILEAFQKLRIIKNMK